MTWRGGGATQARHIIKAGGALGVELAGATRHGELRRGAQREERGKGNVVLTQAVVGRIGDGGGEQNGGGEVRFVAAPVFGRCSGEVEARTA